MRIATWNVNSIRAREARVRAWLEAHRPDVLCMQEIKVEDARFPAATFEALGYRLAIHGQRTYNGVAIATTGELSEVTIGFDDGVDDPQARVVAATVAGVRVVCLYVPNGQAVGTDKFDYKLAWLGRLRRWLDRHADPAAPLVLCADWNVAPADLDVHDPVRWHEQVLCSSAERAALAEVMAWGVTDCYRAAHPDQRAYSWWDYRGVSFFKDQGLRIDMILASAPLAARLRDCTIDRDARKGRDASDHAPVVAEFADPA